MVVLLYDLHGLIDAVLLAFDRQARVVQMRAHAQHFLKQADVFIQCAEKRFNLSGNVYGASHPVGGFSCYRYRVADGIPPGRSRPLCGLLKEKLITPYPTPAPRSSYVLVT